MTNAPTTTAGWPVLIAFALFAVAGVVLAVIDIRTHRLPNRIVLPGYPIAVGLLALACILGAPWTSLLRAIAAGAALFVAFVLLRAVSRGGLGGGDVKLAGLAGVFLGWVGWSAVLTGMLAAFVLGGIVGLGLVAARRATRSTAIPFGPFLLAGSWVGIAAGELLV